MEYRVVSVKTNSHSIDIPIGVEEKDFKDNLLSRRVFTIKVDVEKDFLSFVVDYNIYYSQGQEIGSDDPLAFKIEVDTVFKVKGLKQFVDEESQSLTESLVNELAQVAIAHTRGVQSTFTNATWLEQGLIPIDKFDVNDLERVD